MIQTTNRKTIVSALALSLFFIAMTANGQDRYSQNGTSTISIAGTSTLHDWTMTTSQATYDAEFETNDRGEPTRLSSLAVTAMAESLKSGKNAMDKNAYAALKTDKNKEISFQLISSKINGKTIQCSGMLTIAGTTKQTEVQVTYAVLSDGRLQFKGSKQITMTDYNVEPPSFMFGSVKTGNQITVSFDVMMSPREKESATLN